MFNIHDHLGIHPCYWSRKRMDNIDVTDFREVNEVTEGDRYPLPILSHLSLSLGQGNKIFNLSEHWQVPLAPESREITAFSTKND